MWGKTLKGARNRNPKPLCSLYFSVVKNKLYLQPGGSGVCALCEGGAGGHLSTLLSPPPRRPLQNWEGREMAFHVSITCSQEPRGLQGVQPSMVTHG